MFSLLRKSKLVVPVVLGVALSVQAYACPPAKDGTVKPSHITSINVHMPGKAKSGTVGLIDILFPMESGYRVTAKQTGSGKLAPALIKGIKEGKLTTNVVYTYGRTGEIPPGRDIYMHLYNAMDKNLLGKLNKELKLKPQFQMIADDIGKSGHLSVPYVGTYAIFYNPDLIKKEDAPKSWNALADFKGKIAVPGSGCFGMRSLTALYHIVGAKKFEEIIKKADMPAMETIKKDPRESKDKPLKANATPVSVAEGKFPIGIGALTSSKTQELIASGAIEVIWPEEGAIILPHIVVVRENPNEADLALVDFIANNMQVRNVLLNLGISSTLKGAKVIPIAKENNFNYKYIPIKEIMRKDIHKDIIEMVEKNKPKG
ncbi:MAG: extracellular solute-binding protein [Sulfurovum sp.]|nr:extracellular solute-binding protein [Sulfurovum sp.]